MSSLELRIERALGEAVRERRALSGGCIGDVYRVVLSSGDEFVVKSDRSGSPRLDIEGYMLGYLREHSDLPVPDVVHDSPDLLVMTFVPGDSQFTAGAEHHAAELLANLHGRAAPAFGLDRDTLIGGLHQPNPAIPQWIPFFREHRLLHMGRKAHEEKRLDSNVLGRIEKFGDKLDELLVEADHPSLVHGDVWTTNVLAAGDRITGFVDPAIYYAHPEMELAFTTLFGTFGDAFFGRYHEIRPITPGFFEDRRDIYNLYPLLVHVRLFGSSYLSGVDRVLRRHGC